MTAKQILEMIENVDPSDTAKMDEIDEAVFQWRLDLGFTEHFSPSTGKARKYTRSRDALKAIRPEGYHVEIIIHDWGSYFAGKRGYETICGASLRPNYSSDEACPYNRLKTVTAPRLRTEALAELHAIIQAIENERNRAA